MRSAIPFAGVAQQERRTSSPEVTGLTPVPRSTIAPGFDLVRPHEPTREPLAVAVFGLVVAIAMLVIGLAGAAGWTVVQGFFP